MRITLPNRQSSEEAVQKTLTVLKNGGVIVYPTDTIYGFGCDIFNKSAIARIEKLKGRKKQQTFSVLCADFHQIGLYSHPTNQVFRLMKRILPGAFTFILPVSNRAPRQVIDRKRKTIGIRLPDHAFCLELVQQLGNPIITTSVNVHGMPSMSDPNEIEAEFGSLVDLIVDVGVISGEASTVVDATGEELIVIRQGKGVLEERDSEVLGE